MEGTHSCSHEDFVLCKEGSGSRTNLYVTLKKLSSELIIKAHFALSDYSMRDNERPLPKP